MLNLMLRKTLCKMPLTSTYKLTVHDLVISRGVTEEQWNSIKRPIGLKYGAKTPAELAIAIVAELIDVRYKERYSDEARERHEKSLGR